MPIHFDRVTGMRLLHLTQPCHDPSAVAEFYRQILQLPVRGTRVQVGWSEIELISSADAIGCLHLAFNVAPARFAAAVRWLAARRPLLRDRQGRQRFALADNWQSESVYFAGPDGAVLELIARRRLPSPPPVQGPFHGRELLCVSEVGLPSTDVTAVTNSLGNHFRVEPLAPATAKFAPLGDDEGLLIVVEARRRWFPEQRQLPWARGVQLHLQGPPVGLQLADAQGWELRSVV